MKITPRPHYKRTDSRPEAFATGWLAPKFNSSIVALSLLMFYSTVSLLHADQPFQFSVENNEATITGYTGDLAEVVIPEMIEGMSVAKIGSRAFLGRRELESVSIPKGVHTIESQAFMHCTNLVRISLTEGLENIGEFAFEFFSPLRLIQIPASVRKIDGVPFGGCGELKTIEVAPENQHYSSKDGVLFDKRQVQLIRFPEGKRTSSLLIDSSIVEIPPLALAGCNELGAIKVAEDNPVFSSSDGVLLSKDGTTMLQYPGGLTGPAVIPVTVTHIAQYAFLGRHGVTTVVLPDRITRIDSKVFIGCSSLKTIIFPKGIDVIESDMFAGCWELSQVKIPDSVIRIEENAFQGLPKLSAVKLPKSLAFLGPGVFANCSSMKSIEIPEGVTEIGDNAFSGCGNLARVTLPASVTTIGRGAFPDSTLITHAPAKPTSQRQSPAVTPPVVASTPSPIATPESPKIPSVLTLSKPQQLPITREGKVIGSATIPAGTRLKYVRNNGEIITVQHPTLGLATLPKEAFMELEQAIQPVSQDTVASPIQSKASSRNTTSPGKAMLKGWANWPKMDSKGKVAGGASISGGQVALLGKAAGMIVIRSSQQSDYRRADIAVGPNALLTEVDLATLPDVPMPKHQAEILAAASDRKALRAVTSPVSIHLKDKIVRLNIGSPVELAPDQTEVPVWAVKVITEAGEFFVPKSSLIDGPATLASDRPRSASAPKLTRKTQLRYLQFATPFHITDGGGSDIVFMPGARVPSKGRAQTGAQYGKGPGFRIEESNPGYSGYATVLPISFFVENGAGVLGKPAPVAAALPGKGTAQDPFMIRSRADFDLFCGDPSKWATGVYTRLDVDIDLADTEFDDSVIAPTDPGNRSDEQPEFNGIFDGNSKKLTGLRITSREEAGSGLFRVIGESGVVRNLRFISVNVQGLGLNTQPVALCGVNQGTIENCGWTGVVEGDSGTLSSAGLCRNNGEKGKIIHCFAGGDGNSRVTGWRSGSICSHNEGLIERCGSAVHNRGAESGGLVSSNRGVIRESLSTGVITDSVFVGGLCSTNSGLIENCLSTTEVLATGKRASDPFVGGLVGIQRGVKDAAGQFSTPEIRNCLAIGRLASEIVPGGLVGHSKHSGPTAIGKVEASFWNLETTQANDSSGGTGLSTLQMKDQAIFKEAGWDFKSIWRMGENGPVLRNANLLQ